MYGPHTNEVLVGRAIRDRRDKVVLATKCGIVRLGGNPHARALDGSPAYIRSAIDASLKRLGVDHVDLYQLHRVDPKVPIEDSVGALADIVKAGKARFIGLSEAGSESLRRASKVHPIASVQTEYSLWSRDPEDDVLATCRELGIGFIAYSPLGRGFLTGEIRRFEDFAEDDYRRLSPRFQGDNFARNLELVARIGDLAKEKGCTASQLALAWVMSRGDDVVPIPGTKRRRYLEQNAAAADIVLTAEELARIDAVAPRGAAAGTRYPEALMSAVNR